MEPQHSTVSVNGHDTEVISVPAQRSSNLHFVIFPGNPGVVHFYETFLACIAKRLAGACHVHAVAYAGHELRGKTNKLFDLEEQIQHKGHFLDHLRKQSECPEQARFVLFGHSIGSFLALKLLAQRSDVLHAFAAFPFIRFDLSAVQSAGFRLLFLLRPLMLLITRLLACLPRPLLRAIARVCLGFKEPLLTIACRLAQPSVVNNFLSLGYDELFHRIPRVHFPPDFVTPAMLARTTYLYTPGDRWSPKWQMDDLLRLPGSRGVEVHRAGVRKPSTACPFAQIAASFSSSTSSSSSSSTPTESSLPSLPASHPPISSLAKCEDDSVCSTVSQQNASGNVTTGTESSVVLFKTQPPVSHAFVLEAWSCEYVADVVAKRFRANPLLSTTYE